VDGAAVFIGEFLQVLQVEAVVFFGMKTDGAVVAALDDVPGYFRYGEAGTTGHGGSSWSICKNASR